MSFFLNLPIGKKLLLAFGLMATLMLILGLFAIYELEKVNYSSTVIVDEHLPRLVAAAKIDVSRRLTIVDVNCGCWSNIPGREPQICRAPATR